MVASVVVSHEAAVGGLSFGLLCRRLVRWRQRSGCACVRDRARAWARAQVVHRTTGTKVQAQEQIWEDRARETKAQAHRGTGAQGQACARGLKIGPQGFCCHGVRGTRCEVVVRCVMFLVPLLHISQALKNRVENMCPSEYVASYDNACTLRNVSLFLCRRLVDVHSQSRAQKKTTGHEVPLFTALMLASSAHERDSPAGDSSVQEAKGSAWEAARRTCFSHVSFSSGSFFWRAACIELAGVVECFSRSTFPRAHLVLRWHTNTYIHMLQVAHSLHMFLGGGT